MIQSNIIRNSSLRKQDSKEKQETKKIVSLPAFSKETNNRGGKSNIEITAHIYRSGYIEITAHISRSGYRNINNDHRLVRKFAQKI